jgi:hypothetical protein
MTGNQRELDKLRELFNAPKIPEDLAEKLKANLQTLAQEQQPPRATKLPYVRRTLVFATAAGLLLAMTALFLEFQSTSSFIALAYAHTQEEAGLMGAMDGGYEKWFRTAALKIPEEANDIVLSKNCSLGDLKAKHLRFDLPNKGTINLFLYKETAGAPAVYHSGGRIADQAWMSASPRGDIRWLAIYNANVDKQQVAHIIHSMFEKDSA